MRVHTLLGYLVALLASGGFALAALGRARRSVRASRWMYVAYLACIALSIPAVATGVFDNAAASGYGSAASAAPYAFFLAGSFFTLVCALAAWRTVNPGVLWDERHDVAYGAGALGPTLLSLALAALGRLAIQ